jgi:hypothetical protein
MGEVSTIGLDIAKSVFQVHGVAVDGALNMVNVEQTRLVSLPKTLSKLTRGPRRNQNIIAHDCVGTPVPPPAVRPLQAATAAGSRDSGAAASDQCFAPRARSTAFAVGRSRSIHPALSSLSSHP